MNIIEKNSCSNIEEILEARVLADSEALKIKYSDEKLINEYQPSGSVAKTLYNVAEKIRYEKIGSDQFKGVKNNLNTFYQKKISESNVHSQNFIADAFEAYLRGKVMDFIVPENKKDENLYITESFLNYGNEYGTTGITPTQTTSLLNTPYFANAISESADTLRQRNGGQNVYFTSLGYLLVNSLPLATLKEKYKSFNDDGVETELDYVWSVMSKFSAIHRIPYTWILKYGSIWHRYKTYVEDNVDILDSVWTGVNVGWHRIFIG